MIRLASFLSLFLALACVSSSANGQGLIFALPEDGKAVDYEGELTQGTSADDENPLKWSCELTIQSVGKEDAEYQGKVQPCRWLEIKCLTGSKKDTRIDPGPSGSRIYKILVPESAINAEPVDADGIPNDMLPIVKGFRRVGEDAVTPIKTPVLRFYPTICMLASYVDPEIIATNAAPEVIWQGPAISAVHKKGKVVMESQKIRTTNEAEYWVSKDVEFGLARWIVTETVEEKELAAPRSEFKVTTVKKVDMKLSRKRDNAESELVTDGM
ncbi:MAG: hypothetical protein JNM43_00585 [Planctomycetaceae bacterium]|nr:hypothetical protein [Planctomycetaceae bacterium]